VENLPANYTQERDQLVRVSAATLDGASVANTSSNCLKSRFRARYPQLAGRRIILFLSRLDPKKGLDLLLPAFAQVRVQNPDVALVLAGNGDQSFVTGLEEEAVRLGIAGDILWTDFLAGEEKWAVLSGADVFVLPSYSENFGVAVVEAMAFGLPVVVSDQVGIHREVAEAQAGLVVPCAWEELARALTRLVRDKQLRSRMGENGKRLAQTHFSLEAVTGKLINVYIDVTTSQPRG
jgi:glycosyltransferase involved in cell wall biosynthesis